MDGVGSDLFLIKMPWQGGPTAENIILPIGLGILSEVLSQAVVPHEVYDLAADPAEQERMLSDYRLHKPRIVAVSFGSAGYLKTYDFLRNLKQIHPDVTIVVGGWHPSSLGHRIFDECEAIDICVLGPGENALPSLATGSGDLGLPNVLVRDNVPRTPTVKLKEALGNQLWPFPRYTKFNPNNYQFPYWRGLMTSRGCPFQCTFCSSKRISGVGYFPREIDEIIAEMEYHIREHSVNHFQILDDNATLQMERAAQLFEHIIRLREKYPTFTIDFPNGVRADACNVELLRVAKRCGVTVIGLGVESANDDILRAMKKGETVEDIRKAISAAFDVGLSVRAFFLIGMPGETREHVLRSMEFVKSFRRTFDNIYINHPVPLLGTELFEQLDSRGLLVIRPKEYLNDPGLFVDNKPIFETPELSFAERRELWKQFHKVRLELCPSRRKPGQIAYYVRLSKSPRLLVRKVINKISQNLQAMFSNAKDNLRKLRSLLSKLKSRLRSWYRKIQQAFAKRYFRLFEKSRVGRYDREYFLDRDIPEVVAYNKRLIRPGDMGACLCYAYGLTDYSQVRAILGIPEDNPHYLPDNTDFRQQLAEIKKHARRKPKLVVSIGTGRGEIDLAFLLDGVKCVGIDPSPAAERIYRDTMIKWGGGIDYEFLNLGAYQGMLELRKAGVIPDTVIFCESIEHIPKREFAKTMNLIRWMLTQTKGLLIIANWIDFHPIRPDKSGWDHIHPIDDTLYDNICRQAKRVIFRKGSHLVIQF